MLIQSESPLLAVAQDIQIGLGIKQHLALSTVCRKIRTPWEPETLMICAIFLSSFCQMFDTAKGRAGPIAGKFRANSNANVSYDRLAARLQ